MPLVPYALVTLADTKTFLGITTNAKDALLEMLINIATDYIQKQCNVDYFKGTTYTFDEFDGSGTDQVRLPHFPAWDLTLLEERTGTGVMDWRTIPSTEYWLDGDSGIITWTSTFDGFNDSQENEDALSQNIFIKEKRKYRATYDAGYNTIPYDLQFACMTLVGQMYNTKAGSGIKSESLGDHSITYQDITEITSGGGGILNDILSKYRDIPLVK